MTEVKVPELAESISEASLLGWSRADGDTVAAGETLAEIETDKIVLEVPAPVSGTLRIAVPEAATPVGSGQVIGRIEEGGAEVAAPEAGAAPPSAAVPASPAPGGGTLAMPSARKIAAEQGRPLEGIEGHGKGGRITKEDVLKPAAAQQPAPAAALPAPPAVGARQERRVPMTRLRARIAERLLDSQASAALLTTFNEVDMGPVMELRKRHRDRFEKEWGVKLGFMSFFVRAVTRALRKFPVVNASVEGGDIIYHEYYDVGIAVSSPRGLVVPILRDADLMTFAEIEAKIADFGARARDGKLGIEDITGGTFSISNGGVFGSMLSTPIVNPPQSAILGVHATKERPVAVDGQVVVRPMNYFALSYDHRIIDGREAVLFLVAVKEGLEDPTRLLIDV